MAVAGIAHPHKQIDTSIVWRLHGRHWHNTVWVLTTPMRPAGMLVSPAHVGGHYNGTPHTNTRLPGVESHTVAIAAIGYTPTQHPGKRKRKKDTMTETMNTINENATTNAEVATQLAASLAELQHQHAVIQEQIDNIKIALAAICPLGTTTAGNHEINISRPRRIDPKQAEKRWPLAEHPELYDTPEPKISTKKMHALLAPDDLTAVQTVGKTVVKLR